MDDKVAIKVNNFFSQFPQHTHSKGEILIGADTNPSGVFYLEKGFIRKYYITSQGAEFTINIFKQLSFFPMSWVLADIHNLNYYEAMTTVVVRKAPKDKVKEFLSQETDVLKNLIRRVYIGMEGMFMHIESLMTGDALTKVAVTFLIFGRRFGKRENGRILIDLKMTEGDIASYAGVSRETVSRSLHKLKEKGIVESENKKYYIQEIKKLEEELL